MWLFSFEVLDQLRKHTRKRQTNEYGEMPFKISNGLPMLFTRHHPSGFGWFQKKKKKKNPLPRDNGTIPTTL